MDDKRYEEAAREYLKVEPPMLTTIDSWYDLALIFRWYDERREKKTCEWTRIDDTGFQRYWITSCEGHYGSFDLHKFCPHCGRRIVEKEGK